MQENPASAGYPTGVWVRDWSVYLACRSPWLTSSLPKGNTQQNNSNKTTTTTKPNRKKETNKNPVRFSSQRSSSSVEKNHR